MANAEPGGMKVTFVWDIVDPNGGHLNRVSGEEVVPVAGAPRVNVWDELSPVAIQAVSDKAVTALQASLGR